MPHNSELTLNSQLAAVLRTLNPAWEALSAERTQVLRAAAGQRPDILLPDPLLVLETEFAPAATVEADARQRLGTQTASHWPSRRTCPGRHPAALTADRTAAPAGRSNPRRQVPVLHPRPHGRGCAHPVAGPGLVDGRRIRSGHLHGILQSVCFPAGTNHASIGPGGAGRGGPVAPWSRNPSPSRNPVASVPRSTDRPHGHGHCRQRGSVPPAD